MTNNELIRDNPEELKKRGSRTDPIKSRDLYVQGKRWRLRSYKPEMMKELCNSCQRLFICDHILQPMPSKDGQQLCIEYQPHPSTRTCVICGSLNKIAVDSVRCWKCGTLLIKPGPGLRIRKVRISEEGEVKRVIKRNITE